MSSSPYKSPEKPDYFSEPFALNSQKSTKKPLPPLFPSEIPTKFSEISPKFDKSPEKLPQSPGPSPKKLWETEEKHIHRPLYTETLEKEREIKEKLEKQEDFKAQLPHIREKSQKPALIPAETGRTTEFPRFFESRTYNFPEKPEEIAKNAGFYGEGLKVSKSPPRKVQFSVQVRENTQKAPVFVEEFKQTATFSKHIFEDKTIIEVLERNAVIRSKKPGNFEENFDDFSRFSGKKREILHEKHGKTVIEKGEEPSDPYARMGHILFKALNLLSYLALNETSNSTNLIYECIIIFTALDFWVVKNVSARMLIGFRYWSEFGVDFKEKWFFETYCDKTYKENKMNTRFFWISQTVFSIIWFLYAVYELFSLDIAMTICLIFCFLSCFANLFVFRRCGQLKKSYMDKFMGELTELDRTLYTMRGSIKMRLTFFSEKLAKKPNEK